MNSYIQRQYMTKEYIYKWKTNFNKVWKLYDIKESEFEFDDNIIIIENYFTIANQINLNKKNILLYKYI